MESGSHDHLMRLEGGATEPFVEAEQTLTSAATERQEGSTRWLKAP